MSSSNARRTPLAPHPNRDRFWVATLATVSLLIAGGAAAEFEPGNPCVGAQTCEVVTGTYMGPYGPVTGEYVLRDGQAVVGGDMLIEPIVPCPNCLAITRVGPRLWENGVIPYEFHESYAVADRGPMLQAIDLLNDRTILQIIPRTNEVDYVLIERESGFCAAALGRQGGAQNLSVSNQCVNNVVILIHEMMHHAGVFHEFQRQDRIGRYGRARGHVALADVLGQGGVDDGLDVGRFRRSECHRWSGRNRIRPRPWSRFCPWLFFWPGATSPTFFQAASAPECAVPHRSRHAALR